MNSAKKTISEGIATDLTSTMKMIYFIDLGNFLDKKVGMMIYMFPNVGGRKLYRWVRNVGESDAYSRNIDPLKSISSRFMDDETLTRLYKTVNTLKDQETSQDENDQRVQDIMLVFRKISKYIKDQLTQEEKTIFGQIQNVIGTAASNASKSIEGSIGASTTQPEPEQEETEETE
jgi:hemerythrin superfamily protein